MSLLSILCHSAQQGMLNADDTGTRARVGVDIPAQRRVPIVMEGADQPGRAVLWSERLRAPCCGAAYTDPKK